MRAQRGFTLLELLVVFAIVALLTALVPLAYDRLRESSQYRDAVRGVLSELRQARYRAVAEGREVHFTVNLAEGTYGAEGRPPKPLPQPLRIRTTVADIELQAGQSAGIRFLPSGGATGGTVEILRPGGAGVRLTVDWLSGAVVQAP
ncbi:MAG: type II secretion system protein, partial [Ramlibacter sp.]